VEGNIEVEQRINKLYDHFFSVKYPNIKTFETDSDAMVTLLNHDFISICEHHYVPFWGYIDIGYLPSKKIIGLSKLTQLVNYYTHRTTLQEAIASDIYRDLDRILKPSGIMIVIRAIHSCVFMRTGKKELFTTSLIRGEFRESKALRDEFLFLRENRLI